MASDSGLLPEKTEVTEALSRLVDSWPSGPAIAITIDGAKDSIRLPLDWLQRGKIDNWTAILQLLHLFVNESGKLYPSAREHPVDQKAHVESGSYALKPEQGMLIV